ncbi:MAG TPA: hypothetical protein VM582_10570, partial [Candidatus Thermoplasmatota archaeon]|nr:hypothetical protein [Candidatus Thermoplasmatota archaeon]
ATIARTNASENVGNGFRYDPMGPFEVHGPTPLRLVRALHNGGSGLLNTAGNATSVHDSWWEGNSVAGVKNNDLFSLIDARENYWGSPDGPSHALNPTAGDRVEGGVIFVPFRETPPASSGP